MRSRAAQASRLGPRSASLRWLALVLVLLGLTVTAVGSPVRAQSSAEIWIEPANLSRSRAASEPIIAVQPDGSMRVLWWDQFDGVTISNGALAEDATWQWSEPVPATIAVVEALERPTPEGEQFAYIPIAAMPRVIGDVAGRAQAFWLGQADEETGARPLLHSILGPGTTSWSTPRAVAESALDFEVAVDAGGSLHLVYQRELNTVLFPAGIYYRRSVTGGASWSTASALDTSRYYRLPWPEDAHLHLAARDAGAVYVVWDVPHLEQVLLASSPDGGTTWEEPRSIGDPGGRPQHSSVVAVPGGEALILWQDARLQGTCGLYQAAADEILANPERTGQRVLEELTVCPDPERTWFLPLGEGQVLMVSEGGGDALTLALWADGHWSAPRRLSTQSADPASGEPVRLSDLRVALLPSPEAGGGTGQRLAVVGVDGNSEIWVAHSGVDVAELVAGVPSSGPVPTMVSGDVEQAGPPVPVNLSHSGAASEPVVSIGPDGALRAFWWDRFDGLMAVEGLGSVSSVLSGTQEIHLMRETWSEARPVGAPVATMPRILIDSTGRVHAFSLEESDAEDTESGLLLYSRLIAAWTSLSRSPEQAWASPAIMADSVISFTVAQDASGALHLAYLRTEDMPDAPAGLYYRRSDDGGAIWNDSQVLHVSRYYRLLWPEEAYLSLASDAAQVYVTWREPRLGQLLLTGSLDGGDTWEDPRTIGDVDRQAQWGRLMAVPGDTGDGVWLLWENAGSARGCTLYQAPARALLTGDEVTGRRVLEGLTTCPDPGSEEFLLAGEGQVLMVAGSGSDTLTVAAWDGGQWSEPQRLSHRFEDPETGAQIYLDGLRAALAQGSPAGEGWAGRALVVVGTDRQGEVWAVPGEMGALEMVFAPPSPWSAAAAFSQGEGLSSLPAMAVDAEGHVHALWTESEAPGQPGTALYYARWDGPAELATGAEEWTRPAQVIDATEGGAAQPALAAVGERLHAVWSDGPNGEVLYSRAFLRDAYAASGWEKPQSLPAPAAIGSWPDIAADVGGNLHVVYAVPVNEGRGVYYTRSGDSGESWSPARQVFDAAAAGWAMADRPRLAVDRQGTLHVVWVRAALAGDGLSEGIYYARSSGGGETWSGPLQVAEGAYAWPEVGTGSAGQVHLLWNEVGDGRAWWHQWSADGGQEWTRAKRVRSFADVPGPVGLAADGAGTLHLVGLGRDGIDEPALLYATWGSSTTLITGGERWSEPEAFRLDFDAGEPGVAVALLPAMGRLSAVARGEIVVEGKGTFVDLWHASRVVPTVIVAPAPTLTPDPTPTPPPTGTPAPTPTATPDLSGGPLPGAQRSMDLLLTLALGGGLAALIVVGVFGARFILAGRR